MKGVKEFYDKTALNWADKWYEDESMLPYIKEFFKYLPRHPKVLDLCCGAGYDSMTMKKLGADVTGIDFSEESIKIAREKNSDIKFVVENMLKDYSYLGKFDGCTVIAGLIHLLNEELIKAFTEVHKVLKDDGYLFIVVKDGTGKNEKSSYVNIDGEDYDREFYMHTIEELKLYSFGKFNFVEEIEFEKDSIWKYYIFKKCDKRN